ncbi:hypothetical protein [Amycolatopsis taiwanensis]|nr:hypothetical protein [Amycolatopsis taiwanensis]
MFGLAQPPLFTRLQGAGRILIAGAGGGFDIYAGLPLALTLRNQGVYLGAFSIPGDSPEAAMYLDAVAHAQAATPRRPGIVNGQIAAAIRGEVGNVHATARTGDSELFVNPLSWRAGQ